MPPRSLSSLLPTWCTWFHSTLLPYVIGGDCATTGLNLVPTPAPTPKPEVILNKWSRPRNKQSRNYKCGTSSTDTIYFKKYNSASDSGYAGADTGIDLSGRNADGITPCLLLLVQLGRARNE